MGFVEEANRMFSVLADIKIASYKEIFFSDEEMAEAAEWNKGNPKSKSKPLPIMNTLFDIITLHTFTLCKDR